MVGWSRLKYFLIPLPTVVYFKDWIGSVGTVNGDSMQPTLNPKGALVDDRAGTGAVACLVRCTYNQIEGQLTAYFAHGRVLLNKFSARCCLFHRGDVCYLRNPHDPSEWIAQRLIAVEGDRVRTRRMEMRDIPPGCGWFEGDNSSCTNDSHSFGPVPLALIRARVSYVVWPPWRAGAVDKNYPKDRVMEGPRWHGDC